VATSAVVESVTPHDLRQAAPAHVIIADRRDRRTPPTGTTPPAIITDCGRQGCWRRCRGPSVPEAKRGQAYPGRGSRVGRERGGTTTKKDAVSAALDFGAKRRRRIEQFLDDPDAFGVGLDIVDSQVMRQARR
jgi:hypothetical protein